MDTLEHLGKTLLDRFEIRIPRGGLASTPDEAFSVATELGVPLVIKAQVPFGGRGKLGGVRFASSPEEAREIAEDLLASSLRDHFVEELLVEEQVSVVSEFYAAVVNDSSSRSPVVLFSADGGVDIEELGTSALGKLRKTVVDLGAEFDERKADTLLEEFELPGSARAQLAHVLARMYRLYREVDAELVELNPLGLSEDGVIWALDCKLVLDEAALPRHPELVELLGSHMEPKETPVERKARDAGLRLLELGGDVGVLANGAGLTMATLDAIARYGGRAANFLEIGGDAYKKASIALRLLAEDLQPASILINFCGAFARTDVMVAGVVEAIEELRPTVPISFSIRGNGEQEAVQLLQSRLGVEPCETMEEAVQEAVNNAAEQRRRVL